MDELKEAIEALKARVNEKEQELKAIQQELNVLKAKLDDAIADKRVADIKSKEEERVRSIAKEQAELARQEAEKQEENNLQQIASETTLVHDQDSTNTGEEPEIPQVGEAQHEAIMRKIDELSKDIGASQTAQYEAKPTLGDKVSRQKLNDIKRGIGINERFLFANELFNGDMGAFTKAVDELNHVDSEGDANRLLDENLGVRYQWDSEDETVIAFRSLVSRRFT
ncbi:MAG: hypothetical protein Salg2KO_06420 [Salibacteraceae bacterium]